MYNRRPQKKEYDNSNRGALFARQKRSANAPDMGGEITLSGEVLDYILDEARQGRDPKVSLSAWRKQGNSGPMMSLSVQKPWDGGQSRGGDRYEQRDNYQRSPERYDFRRKPERRDDRDQPPLDDEIPFDYN